MARSVAKRGKLGGGGVSGGARLKTQAQVILAQLRAGRSITQIDALQEFGCNRLAARIHDLREAGHRIKTQTVTTSSGAKIAEYRLADPEFEQRGLFA